MAGSNQNIEIIMELKSAVLNVDWEISDETLAELSQEVVKLKSVWAGEKVLLVYLQILGALCQYIGLSREKSHPGTFLLLKEVFGGLEEVVCHPEMEPAEKNTDVIAYADRYNTLKSEIAAGDFIPGPPKKKEEPKSTMDTLMDDDEDHSTDTVFDSMLNAMVQVPEDDKSAESNPPDDEPEEEPELEQKTPAPATPPARPPVQAAFNKADGTEVEPDRNEADEFAEADDLLDDFFDDDDVPAPGVESTSDDEIFDLNELPDDEEDILELSADDDSAAAVDAGELSIDLDAESEAEDESFQEMEDTLDDFFGDDDEEGDLVDPVGKDEDDSLIDEALDDFFEDDVEGEVAEPPIMSLDEEEDDEVEDDLQLSAETAVGDGDSESLDLSLDEPELMEENVDIAIPVPEVSCETALVEDDLASEHAEPDGGADASCVENLQMLLLSVEWEVDDKLLLRLQEEVESLTTLLKEEHIACLHLDFLGTVIRYVGREQADVISDSMACLKLVADSLEGFMQNKAEGSRYAADAVRCFVDWHELVVVDFEKRLVEIKDALAATEAAQPEHEPEPPVESTGSPLSAEMMVVKESILQEVRELIAQELAGSKE